MSAPVRLPGESNTVAKHMFIGTCLSLRSASMENRTSPVLDTRPPICYTVPSQTDMSDTPVGDSSGKPSCPPLLSNRIAALADESGRSQPSAPPASWP